MDTVSAILMIMFVVYGLAVWYKDDQKLKN